MKNTIRDPDYIKIMHKIKHSHKLTQLDSMRQLVERYVKQRGTYSDLIQLMAAIEVRRFEIDPYYAQ